VKLALAGLSFFWKTRGAISRFFFGKNPARDAVDWPPRVPRDVAAWSMEGRTRVPAAHPEAVERAVCKNGRSAKAAIGAGRVMCKGW
jgi:hypothetical protein